MISLFANKLLLRSKRFNFLVYISESYYIVFFELEKYIVLIVLFIYFLLLVYFAILEALHEAQTNSLYTGVRQRIRKHYGLWTEFLVSAF